MTSQDGWEPPPRPSMPAMPGKTTEGVAQPGFLILMHVLALPPGPPSLAGIAADATLGFTPEGRCGVLVLLECPNREHVRSSLHDSLLEGRGVKHITGDVHFSEILALSSGSAAVGRF